MVALFVCLLALSLLPLAYRMGYRKGLLRVSRQALEVAEGYQKLQYERQAVRSQRELIDLSTQKLQEIWQHRQTTRARDGRLR